MKNKKILYSWIIIFIFLLGMSFLAAGDFSTTKVDVSFMRGSSVSCLQKSCSCEIKTIDDGRGKGVQYDIECPKIIYGTAVFTSLIFTLPIAGFFISLFLEMPLGLYLRSLLIYSTSWFLFWEFGVAMLHVPVLFGDPWRGNLFITPFALPWVVYKAPFDIFLVGFFVIFTVFLAIGFSLLTFSLAHVLRSGWKKYHDRLKK